VVITPHNMQADVLKLLCFSSRQAGEQVVHGQFTRIAYSRYQKRPSTQSIYIIVAAPCMLELQTLW
jgi:hypothetical protein